MRNLYEVERLFPHSREQVWRAWTDPVDLEQWYRPVDLSVVPGSVISQPVVDGAWTVGVDVPQFGFVAYFFGRYTLVDPLVRFEHTLHYTQDADAFAARDESTEHHLVAVDFEVRESGTWVRWTQIGEMPEEQVTQTKAGMESYFDSLAAYLAR